MIGEDWQETMHQQIRAQRSRTAPYLFFVTLYIVGNLFLMNLLLAILLKNFEVEEEQDNQEDEKVNEESADGNYQVAKNWLTKSIREIQLRFRFR